MDSTKQLQKLKTLNGLLPLKNTFLGKIKILTQRKLKFIEKDLRLLTIST